MHYAAERSRFFSLFSVYHQPLDEPGEPWRASAIFAVHSGLYHALDPRNS